MLKPKQIQEAKYHRLRKPMAQKQLHQLTKQKPLIGFLVVTLRTKDCRIYQTTRMNHFRRVFKLICDHPRNGSRNNSGIKSRQNTRTWRLASSLLKKYAGLNRTLFQNCLCECIVSLQWLEACVTAIHKKGKNNLFENYRPIRGGSRKKIDSG